MWREEGTAGGRVALIKARRCGGTGVIWGMERDWVWPGCQGSEGNSGRKDWGRDSPGSLRVKPHFLTVYESIGIQGTSSRKPSLISSSLLSTFMALVAQPWKGVGRRV